MEARAPRVLVDVMPEVFAEAVGHALSAAGFNVLFGADADTESAFDAIVVGPGQSRRDTPISLTIMGDQRVLVRRGVETGLISAEGPADLASVLHTLLADQIGRVPRPGRSSRSAGVTDASKIN